MDLDTPFGAISKVISETVKLIGKTTLFQKSALRLTPSDIIDFASHIILTNADFRFVVGEQLQQVGIVSGPILIEPEAKNTAPSI